MSIAIFTLTSPLHNAAEIDSSTTAFINRFNFDTPPLVLDDFASYGTHALDLIYVRTGGTERQFVQLLPQLLQQSQRPVFLLASGESNSLAASIEMLAYLRHNGIKGEVLHGLAENVEHRIKLLARAGETIQKLHGQRLGVIGQPSDWLIASTADNALVKRKLGIELCDIGIDELLDEINATPPAQVDESLLERSTSQAVSDSLSMSMRIHTALRAIVERHQLSGFTLRCFDLLNAVRGTGCLALAKLNADGIVAGCEGDVPALLSMVITQALLGVPGFQANPSRIDTESGLILLAHCTIPLNMVTRYELDTHFESGIGVGVRGFMHEGPVTIFKVAGDLSRHFAEEGMLIRNQTNPTLCRTQQIIHLRRQERMQYFLTDPIGNHHIVVPGHCKAMLDEILSL